MNYLDLLKKLIALGSKLPVVWPKIQQWLALTKEIAVDLGFGPPTDDAGTLNMEAASAEELAAEAEVGKLLAAPGAEAAFDGSRLRNLWKFLQDSGLLEALMPLLIKLLGK